MSSRPVNVRLDEERLRKTKALREKGIALSELVRAAIDQAYEKAFSTRGPRNLQAILAHLDAEYPITARDFRPLEHDVHDRQQAAAAIQKRLARRRRRPRGR
jgi:hypothetical protein